MLKSLFVQSSKLKFSRFLATMEKDSAETCCSAGKPKSDAYVCTGKELDLSTDLKVYQTGSGNKKGVVLIYDIFGFDVSQTRRFADSLAESSFNVVMPDIFRGKPWSISNFPPKNFEDLMKWMNEVGAFSIVEKDLVHVRKLLKDTGAEGKPGILGFCYGGKMASHACQSNLYSCGVSVHGAGITPELVKDITVPMMFLPGMDDPPLDSVEELLQKKPFWKDCVFYRFEKMNHGFAAARGDWNDKETREAILQAISMSKKFLDKFIH